MRVSLSVIIPCRNAADYLGEAIDSILCQSGKDVEVIVVNDGSTDDSTTIAALRGARVRIIDLPPSGAAIARKTGIEAARGDVLAFCDADDLWAEGRLPIQIEFLAQSEGGVCCGLSQSFLTPELRSSTEGQWLLEPVYHLTFAALMITREALQRVGDISTKGADLHIPFFAAIQDCGMPIARLERVVTYRRIHRNNFSRKEGLMIADYARSIKSVLDRRRSHQSSVNKAAWSD